MFPYGTSSLSLGKVIGGVSKTLNIINQAIPLYKQIKPIISNAGSILNMVKIINTPDKPNEIKPIISEQKKEVVLNSPTFFQ